MVKTAIFRDVTPCGLVGAYEHFQGTCCLSHEGAWVWCYIPAAFRVTTLRTLNFKTIWQSERTNWTFSCVWVWFCVWACHLSWQCSLH